MRSWYVIKQTKPINGYDYNQTFSNESNFAFK